MHLTLEAGVLAFVLLTLDLPGRAQLRRRADPRSLAASQEAGQAWVEDGDALALVVPSLVVPQEKNYVLNAAHPQFAGVTVAGSEPFSFDERLWHAR